LAATGTPAGTTTSIAHSGREWHVIGGHNLTARDPARCDHDIYNPSTGEWRRGTPCNHPHRSSNATPSLDGRYLILTGTVL
jgi:hypothetical protein